MNRLTFDPEEDQWKFQPLVPAERSVWVSDVGIQADSGGNNELKNVGAHDLLTFVLSVSPALLLLSSSTANIVEKKRESL